MDQNTKEYIKISISQGRSKEDIYKELLSQGQSIEVIQECFKAIGREQKKEDVSKKTIRIILTIGAILVGAGIFSFIAANWTGMTKISKIFIIFISMFSSYGTGWYFKEKLKLLKTGETLILLGSIIYGAGIFLIGQMFNIRSNWPDAFLLWMIGTIAMAFAVESYLLFSFAIPIGIVAFVGHPIGIFSGFGYNPFLLTSPLLLLASTVITFVTGWMVRKKMPSEVEIMAKKGHLQISLSKEDNISQLFLLLSIFFLGITLLSFNRELDNPFSWQTILFITSVIGLFSAYYLKALYLLLFGLIGITSWWSAQASSWAEIDGVKTSAIFAGLMLTALIYYLLGHLHEKELKWKRFSVVYLVLGIISITGVLFFFSTKLGLSTLGDITKGGSLFGSWQIALSLFVLSVSFIGLALYNTVKRLISPYEFLFVVLVGLLFGIVASLPEQSMFVGVTNYHYGRELSEGGALWSVIFNGAIFFELLGLIFSGYLKRETWMINMGALFLFILIIVKYFDWFFTFLDKSMFFIGAGILLFGVGWFMEKSRRYMISNIKVQEQQIIK